jgi:hypothetical protein
VFGSRIDSGSSPSEGRGALETRWSRETSFSTLRHLCVWFCVSTGCGTQGCVDEGLDVEMRIEVVCYSGYKGDERPLRFRLGSQDYVVEELVDQWYEPQDACFKVRANDGNVYILRRRSSVPEGEWSVDQFLDMRRGR